MGRSFGSKEEWASRYSSLNTEDNQSHILIQKVEHDSRVHLDIETDNIEAEVERLSKLGAQISKRFERWVVMEAPTGHKFCVVNPQRKDFESASNINEWQ